LITELASWLRNESRDPRVPGGARISAEFSAFCEELPHICAKRQLEPAELTAGDYAKLVAEYVATIP